MHEGKQSGTKVTKNIEYTVQQTPVQVNEMVRGIQHTTLMQEYDNRVVCDITNVSNSQDNAQ